MHYYYYFYFFTLVKEKNWKLKLVLPNTQRNSLFWRQVHVDGVIQEKVSGLAEVNKEGHPDCREERCG